VRFWNTCSYWSKYYWTRIIRRRACRICLLHEIDIDSPRLSFFRSFSCFPYQFLLRSTDLSVGHAQGNIRVQRFCRQHPQPSIFIAVSFCISLIRTRGRKTLRQALPDNPASPTGYGVQYASRPRRWLTLQLNIMRVLHRASFSTTASLV
jgi:hypothetical protein